MVRPLDGRSDQVLLDAYVRDGDADALATLVARHVPRHYRLIRALTCCSPETAQRVVQECWVEVLARDGAALADVAVMDLVRDAVAVRALALAASPAASEPAGRLERAVALVPAEARQVFVLHDPGGMSPEQIAALLHRPVAQVKVELWHARLAVQTLLGAEGGADERSAHAPATDELGATWSDPVPPTLIGHIVHTITSRTGERRGPGGASALSRLLGGGLAAAALLLGSLWLARAQGTFRIVDAPDTPASGRSVMPPVARPWVPRVAGVVVSATVEAVDQPAMTGTRRFAPPATAVAPVELLTPRAELVPNEAGGVAAADAPVVVGAVTRASGPRSEGSDGADSATPTTCPNRRQSDRPAGGALVDRPDG